jgi:phenylpropionate dioxygenase-like ring-hydroxylating dioxygenase large terminal subunit
MISTMSRLRYWHPVLPAAALPVQRAAAVRIAGRDIALYRTAAGVPAALEDRCAHRRLKLSVGTVVGDRLRCAYHGWSYTATGQADSPATPGARACVRSYACAEAHGAIWIRERDGEQPLPDLEKGYEDWVFVGCVQHAVDAPLLLLLDNFAEVEHTMAMHRQFGIAIRNGRRGTMDVETTPETFTVRNAGPSKTPPLTTRLLAWTGDDDDFHSDYTFRFDPPCSSVTHYWTNPRTARERMAKYHLYHYFAPVDERRSMVMTFGHVYSRWPVPRALTRAASGFVRRKITATIDEDVWLLRNLADHETSLEGMKLGRFDRVLGLTRERVARVYGESNPEE